MLIAISGFYTSIAIAECVFQAKEVNDKLALVEHDQMLTGFIEGNKVRCKMMNDSIALGKMTSDACEKSGTANYNNIVIQVCKWE